MTGATVCPAPGVAYRQAASIVVGVGASAGGLEALGLLLGQVRPNGRVAYVVAQHIGRGTQADLVVRVIQRGATLPVHLGHDGQLVEADSVYVIPADCDGIVINGALKLLPCDTRRTSSPCVDVLLQSLADHLGPRGWAVILSGTGRDGALGCRAIRQAGGFVVIQDPAEAGFSGMPEAAIEPGWESVTLRAGRIGSWVDQQLSGDVSAAESSAAPAEDLTPVSSAAPAENLTQVISRVREVTGIDFSGYREETLWRRLISRRKFLELDPAAYESLLLSDTREAQQLQRLLLVSVSSFWRDRDSFDALVPALMQRISAKPAGESVRVWVAGCASGEEAYTLASMLLDVVARLGGKRTIEIVATDLNHEALALAQTGEYSHKAFREAPAGWLERWFTSLGQSYLVGPALASCVRFEFADVEADPQCGLTDSSMDLVSCRNLLIYFMSHKQDRVIARFRKALRPDGLLFLGSAENLSPASLPAFRPLDPNHRIFLRRS